MPPTRISQCRCDPVTRPVAPTLPSELPRAHLIARLHGDLAQVEVAAHHTRAVIDDHRVTTDLQLLGEDHDSAGRGEHRLAHQVPRCRARRGTRTALLP